MSQAQSSAQERNASDAVEAGSKPAMSTKASYFPAAIDWDEQRRLSLVKRSERNKRLAWGNGALAAIAIASITVLLPLKSFIPVVIRVNELTGAYDVDTNWQKINMADPKWDKTKLTDLTRYINAREGYSRGEAEKNYQAVFLMSCGSVRNDWDQYFKPENNPNSPLTSLGVADTDSVRITNVTFLPTDRDDLQTAQIRYEKTVNRGSTPPVLTRYISTVEFKYDKANTPSEIPYMQFNAFGMCVTRYRRDQDGESRQLPMTQAPAAPDAVPAPVAPTPTPPQPQAGAYSGTVTPETIGANQGEARQ